MEHRSRPHRALRAVIACLALAALLASCGDDDDDTSADGTTTTEGSSTSATDGGGDDEGDVCADREELQDSVAELGDVDVVAEGTSGVEDALDDVKEDLAAVRSSAGSELEPEVDAVESALEDLESAIGDLGSGGAAQEAVSAISAVTSAAGDLIDSLGEGC